ncbi:DUF4202 domain-containing protein [Cerasicoccus maritimus]|uniref:DUF4202 domain-containing protein n=1 Tax=Cerasicoccus maritimus TaxID=490089 RepID=UPI0028527F65|nr:DUF4202 domain-containing protein [Cerasicoccus maritimus]
MFDISIPDSDIANRERFDQAVARFDAINQEDPAEITFEGTIYAAEYLLAQALCYRVVQLAPEASEPLLLASRSQHLRRWERPRSEYPEGRAAYLKWRADLKVFHADESAKVLGELGYEQETIDAVRELNLKKNIKGNADCQTLEDGLCLVFLQFQYDGIVEKYDEAKVISILQKTAKKMSPVGLEAATKLDYSPRGKELLLKALAG